MKLYKNSYKGNAMIQFEETKCQPFGFGAGKIGAIVEAYKNEDTRPALEALINGETVDLPDYATLKAVKAEAKIESLRAKLAQAEAEVEA